MEDELTGIVPGNAEEPRKEPRRSALGRNMSVMRTPLSQAGALQASMDIRAPLASTFLSPPVSSSEPETSKLSFLDLWHRLAEAHEREVSAAAADATRSQHVGGPAPRGSVCKPRSSTRSMQPGCVWPSPAPSQSLSPKLDLLSRSGPVAPPEVVAPPADDPPTRMTSAETTEPAPDKSNEPRTSAEASGSVVSSASLCLTVPGGVSFPPEHEDDQPDGFRNCESVLTPDGENVHRSGSIAMLQDMIDQQAETGVVAKLMGLDAAGRLAACFRMWATITRQSQRLLNFHPLRAWVLDTEYMDNIAPLQHTSAVLAELANVTEAEDIKRTGWARFMVDPSGERRMTWDVFGAVLLFYDLLMIPLLAFNPSPSLITDAMEWLTLGFWSCDVVASCITGYTHEGVTVMEPFRIWGHYARTWMVLDIAILAPDWVYICLQISGQGAVKQEAGGGRLLRSMRIARVARLLRLAKIARLVNLVKDRIDSENLFVGAGVARLIAMLLAVTHLLSCVWYAIGDHGRRHGGTNWLASYDHIDKRSLGYKYFTSYHWTLTQFTPASMDVNPTNLGERFFAVVVLIFGLVLFSSFISSITSSMTQLRGKSEDIAKQFFLLRRYLRQKAINKNLQFRVLRYVEYACREQQGLVSDSSLWVLTMLSDQLYKELQAEVAYVCCSAHPLFAHVRTMSTATMTNLCTIALQQKNLAHGEFLFNPGTEATHLHIVGSGDLQYIKYDDIAFGSTDNESIDDESQIRLQTSDWTCEASLWVRWVHLGMAWASSEVKLVAMDAQSFSTVVHQDLVTWELAANYARRYVEWLNGTPCGKLNDISLHGVGIPLSESFLEDEAPKGNQKQHTQFGFGLVRSATDRLSRGDNTVASPRWSKLSSRMSGRLSSRSRISAVSRMSGRVSSRMSVSSRSTATTARRSLGSHSPSEAIQRKVYA